MVGYVSQTGIGTGSETTCNGSISFIPANGRCSTRYTRDESTEEVVTFALHAPERCEDAGIPDFEISHTQHRKNGTRRQAWSRTHSRRIIEATRLAQTLFGKFPTIVATGVHRERSSSADVRYRQRRIWDHRLRLQRPLTDAEEDIRTHDGIRRCAGSSESGDDEETEDEPRTTQLPEAPARQQDWKADRRRCGLTRCVNSRKPSSEKSEATKNFRN